MRRRSRRFSVLGGSVVEFNFKTTQFSKTKAGFARVTGAIGRSMHIFVGDSLLFGVGAGTDAGANKLVNAKEACTPTIYAKRLTANGVSSNYENAYASGGNTGATLVADWQSPNSYKAGFTWSGSWTFSGSTAAGGCLWTNTVTADTSPIAITTQISVTDMEILDITNAGAAGSGINWNIDGGANTLLDQTLANSIRKTPITGLAAAAHTLNISRGSAVSGTAFYIGYRAWNAGISQVDVLNWGRGSSTSADWIVTANAWSAKNMIAAYAVQTDLFIIGIMINDALTAVPVATFSANMQTIITACKASGADCMLVTSNPGNPVTVSDSLQQTFRSALKTLAISNNIPLLDYYAKPGRQTYAQMVALGEMFNNLHANAAGYLQIGNLVADTVQKWAV